MLILHKLTLNKSNLSPVRMFFSKGEQEQISPNQLRKLSSCTSDVSNTKPQNQAVHEIFLQKRQHDTDRAFFLSFENIFRILQLVREIVHRGASKQTETEINKC